MYGWRGRMVTQTLGFLMDHSMYGWRGSSLRQHWRASYPLDTCKANVTSHMMRGECSAISVLMMLR